MTPGRSRPGRLLIPLLVPFVAAACNDDDSVRPPAESTVALSSQVAADLGEKLVFLLARLPGFEALDAFSDVGSLFLSLTGNRVSNVTVNTNLTGALGQQSYQAVAVTLTYRNAPQGAPPPSGGIIAFRASAEGQPYTDFAYMFGPSGAGAIPGTATGGLSVVAGTRANGYAGTQSWVASDGVLTMGQGTGTDPCPSSALLALAAPGVTCLTQFFSGTFSIEIATAVPPATGTKQAALPNARIIGVTLTVDCGASTLC